MLVGMSTFGLSLGLCVFFLASGMLAVHHRLVSPATGREKKFLHPPVLVKNWVLENISSIVTRIHIAKIISHII